MRLRTQAWAWTLLILVGFSMLEAARAEERSTNVPPTLEIEVLDPNADPLGRPAVELDRGEDGNVTVDIPPVVLVHRYYFSGERSFQAQLLPGGPSMVVVNHPKTGERCYIEVQMPPGAPRVTYTSRSIEYDFGDTSVTVCFGLLGHPSVKYRSGPKFGSRVGDFLHVDGIKEHTDASIEHLKQSATRTRLVAYGAAASVTEATGQVLLPVKNMLQVLPFGKIIFDPTMGEKLIKTGDDHKREKDIRRVEKQRQYEQITRRTIR